MAGSGPSFDRAPALACGCGHVIGLNRAALALEEATDGFISDVIQPETRPYVSAALCRPGIRWHLSQDAAASIRLHGLELPPDVHLWWALNVMELPDPLPIEDPDRLYAAANTFCPAFHWAMTLRPRVIRLCGFEFGSVADVAHSHGGRTPPGAYRKIRALAPRLIAVAERAGVEIQNFSLPSSPF